MYALHIQPLSISIQAHPVPSKIELVMLTPIQKLILRQTALSNHSNMVLISYCALFGWPRLRGSRHQPCKIRHLLQWPRPALPEPHLDRLSVDVTCSESMLRIKGFKSKAVFFPRPRLGAPDNLSNAASTERPISRQPRLFHHSAVSTTSTVS